MRSKLVIQAELEEQKGRLRMYLDREAFMLSRSGIQSYGIGNRNLQRFNTELSEVQSMIDKLKKSITLLEAELIGQKSRRAMGVVIRDW